MSIWFAGTARIENDRRSRCTFKRESIPVDKHVNNGLGPGGSGIRHLIDDPISWCVPRWLPVVTTCNVSQFWMVRNKHSGRYEIALKITWLIFVKTSARWNVELKLTAVVEMSLVARLQRVSVPLFAVSSSSSHVAQNWSILNTW